MYTRRLKTSLINHFVNNYYLHLYSPFAILYIIQGVVTGIITP